MLTDNIIKGPVRHYIRRIEDDFGRELVNPRQELVVCKDCRKIWTNECPIRVWGRHEGNEYNTPSVRDVNLDTDYCSRFEFKRRDKWQDQ